MRSYPEKVSYVVELIKKNKVKALLLYGNEKMRLKSYVERLTNLLNWQKKIVDYSELSEDVDFNSIFGNLNLFYQKEIIVVENVPTSINKYFLNFLSSDSVFNLVVLVSEKIKSDSSAKKIFDTKTELISVAFYQQNFLKRDIVDALKPQLIKDVALLHLEQVISKDYFSAIESIERLKILTYGKEYITLEDIKKLSVNNYNTSLDDICFYLGFSDAKKYFFHLKQNTEIGANIMLILRCIVRYYTNLYEVISSVKQNEIAVKFLKPPIFFKSIPNFIKLANYITIEKVKKTLSVLHNTESVFKINKVFSSTNLLESIYYRVNTINYK